MSTGTFAERLAAAIQPGDVVTIERLGTRVEIAIARRVDDYDKPLRGRATILIDAAMPNGLATAIERASAKIATWLEMSEEVQPD